MEEQEKSFKEISKKAIKSTAKTIVKKVGLPIIIGIVVIIALVAAAYAEDIIEIEENAERRNNGPAAVRTYQRGSIAESYNQNTSSNNANASSTNSNSSAVVPSSEGGGYVEDPKDYINGYYTSSKGRVFTVYNQSASRTDWSMRCNRAACAIIASGYSNETPEQGIDYMNQQYSDSYEKTLPGILIPNTVTYWQHYGLKAEREEIGDYQQQIKNQLISGGYVILWMDGASEVTGKTKVWSTNALMHWIALVDYRTNNGNFEMCVLDVDGITWIPEDEFQNGISALVFVNEEK